jgi:hypothetical protein
MLAAALRTTIYPLNQAYMRLAALLRCCTAALQVQPHVKLPTAQRAAS